MHVIVAYVFLNICENIYAARVLCSRVYVSDRRPSVCPI